MLMKPTAWKTFKRNITDEIDVPMLRTFLANLKHNFFEELIMENL